jgi:phosphoenolpyruvate carboxykinase (ATP)
MPNYNITTVPSGRSPEHKLFFGEATRELCTHRPQYCKIGEEHDFTVLRDRMIQSYPHQLHFYSGGLEFRVLTDSDVHAQFVRNMFSVLPYKREGACDWLIIHSVQVEVPHPHIYVHLDAQEMLIAGTTYLGEIKKGVFGILGFELPRRNTLPMHCSAFTYNGQNNLMFGLSGTGKTTLSSDPDFQLISDDEVYWSDNGIHMVEAGCYAKSEGLSPETHPTIFNAVEHARQEGCLVVENPDETNARLSYSLKMVENAYAHTPFAFKSPHNIFFLAMDAEGILPPISQVRGETIRLLFETGYTSLMPGTEAGLREVKKVFSPCYGSPFMPRPVHEYSNLLMERIRQHRCNVYLVNTGMNASGVRYPLRFTRDCIKHAISSEFSTLEPVDMGENWRLSTLLKELEEHRRTLQ